VVGQDAPNHVRTGADGTELPRWDRAYRPVGQAHPNTLARHDGGEIAVACVELATLMLALHPHPRTCLEQSSLGGVEAIPPLVNASVPVAQKQGVE